jgi:hypothetical protein
MQMRHQDTLRGNRHANDHEYCSSCYSVFAASPLEHALNNQAVASSVAINKQAGAQNFSAKVCKSEYDIGKFCQRK